MFYKDQENNKQMSLLKKITFFIFLASFYCSNAEASLYGFASYRHGGDSVKEKKEDASLPKEILNYRQKLRENVVFLTNFARAKNNDFTIIVSGAGELFHVDDVELLTNKYNKLISGKSVDLETMQDRLNKFVVAVDAISAPNSLCGEDASFKEMQGTDFIKLYIENCITKEQAEYAIAYAQEEGSLIHVVRDLEDIYVYPKNETIISESAKNISNIYDAKNVRILTNDKTYESKYKFIDMIRNSNYDIVIINPLFQEKERYTKEEIASLKQKKNGFKRLVIGELSVTEASENAYYWQDSWNEELPEWIEAFSLYNNGRYISRYWEEPFREILANYFKDIFVMDFDGVWLTGGENYDYFEKLTPLM